jgi:hypothetical protein
MYEQAYNGEQMARPVLKHDEDYKVLLQHMQTTLIKRLTESRMVLFRTAAKMKATPLGDSNTQVDIYLNDVYLAAIGETERQQYTCSCCRHFLRDYGSLVTIDADGKTHAALFDAENFPQDNYYFPAVERLQEVVESGRVLGVHKTSQVEWGTPFSGGFQHFSVVPPSALLHVPTYKMDARQKQAQLREDYNRMAEAFEEPYLSVANLTKLQKVLEGDVLAGDEKIAGVAGWLIKTATERANAQNKRVKDNLLWRAIASALPGYTHPNTTTVGTVLDDIAAGKSFEVIKKNFEFKTRADRYRRPVAAATVNQIEEAQKLVEESGFTPSLRRRVATIDDIQDRAYVWRKLLKPTLEEPKQARVFDHLIKKAAPEPELRLPASSMSWNKFSAEILPEVTDIEIYIDDMKQFFSGFMTAADPEAPPIIAYDMPEERNPVTIYQRYEQVPPMYIGQAPGMRGVSPQVWNLEPGRYYSLHGIIKAPHMWGDVPFANMGEQLIFLIKGGYDKIIESGQEGLALFPNLLKPELHQISRVIESYSNQGKPEGNASDQVIGLGFVKGGKFARHLRVTTATGKRDIVIDRWE